MLRKAATTAWWLGVSAYFGGIATLGVVAPAVFETTRKNNLTLPGYMGPDPGGQVGGEIFGAMIDKFGWVEVISLAVMLLGLTVTIATHKTVRRSTWVLLGLWMILATFSAYEAGYLRGEVLTARDKYRATAGIHMLDQTWPEKEAFYALHDRDETFGRLKAYVLLGMILVGAWKGLAEKASDLPDTAVEN